MAALGAGLAFEESAGIANTINALAVIAYKTVRVFLRILCPDSARADPAGIRFIRSLL